MAFDFIIPEQNFERIRNEVASILALEFAAQFILTSNALFSAGIWIERFIPFDKLELPAIKVFYVSSSYKNNTFGSSKGECKIHIEVTVNAKDSASEGGDKKASINCQFLMGKIRFILSHPEYKTLGFSLPGFINGREITDMNVAEPNPNQDGLHTITSNLMLNVRYEENNGDLTSTPGLIYSSQIKIDESEKGYKLEIDNTP